jgi:hypothetical protein
MKRYKKAVKWVVIMLCIFVTSCAAIEEYRKATAEYEETIAKWTSYEDVANWFKTNYVFDYGNIAFSGGGYKLQRPIETFMRKKGLCFDATYLIVDALNRINPKYDARAVFVKNKVGPPDHWVATFTMDGKLYVMDYGAGGPWIAINGVHGPYNSFNEYKKFVNSLGINGLVFE